MRAFVWGALSLGALSIVSGFFLVGSPFAERLRQIDERRVADLSQLQWEIVNFWQAKGMLPSSLEELRDDLRGYRPPLDPQSGGEYAYRILDGRSFELCADFSLPSEGDGAFPKRIPAPRAPEPYGMEETWAHGEGRACFQRTIDPDRFPPRPKEG